MKKINTIFANENHDVFNSEYMHLIRLKKGAVCNPSTLTEVPGANKFIANPNIIPVRRIA